MPVQSEAETRANLISHARKNGCLEQLLSIFDKYDNMYRNAKTKEEGKVIALELVLAIDTLFGKKGPLSVDGVVIRDA
jgi:hypothetical protein